MNAFVPFTTARKTLIANLKGMLTSPDFKPYRDPKYGTKHAKLFLKDYALYAVLRGADFTKTSHLREEGAPNARDALKGIAESFRGILASAKDLKPFANQYYALGRYVVSKDDYKPELDEAYREQARAILEAIDAALAK